MQRGKIYELYKEHAGACAPDEYWLQVKRSIDGAPLDDRQIEMIVSAVVGGLELTERDIVLDLACGNGALSDRIFERCGGGLGIDFVEYLIDIAQRVFARPPYREYAVCDVEEFVTTSTNTRRFTKALCYGSFMYFSRDSARRILTGIRDRFSSVQMIYLGNIPDKGRMQNFYYDKAYVAGVELDHQSPLGLWQTPEELGELAQACGWDAETRFMPIDFYAAHYRFDAILKRRLA